MSLDYAEEALRSCPAAFSELSRKLPNQTHLSSGQAATSGFHLRHTGTKEWLETQMHALPPNHTPRSTKLHYSHLTLGRRSLGGDDLLGPSDSEIRIPSPLVSLASAQHALLLGERNEMQVFLYLPTRCSLLPPKPQDKNSGIVGCG